MFGYCFSNALMSTVLASFAPVPVSGLADQTMLPEVAVLAAPVAAGELLVPLPLPPPLLHADAASTAANATAASAKPPLRWRT
jgi:hypothetical protein